MDTIETIRQRKTIRGFLDRKVSQGTIKEILTDAHMAPSSSNQQPWHFHVVTGEPLLKLCSSLNIAHTEKRRTYDPSIGKTIPKEHLDRTRNLFRQLRPFIKNLGNDQKGFIENGSFRFYNAPCIIFITINESLPESRMMDIGMAAENIMLSAHSRGLGTCAVALALLYEDVIITELNLDKEQKIVLSICLGYPDPDFPVNMFRSSRDNLDRFITWNGFSEKKICGEKITV